MLVAAAEIHSVSVPGTEIDVRLTTEVGRPYDAATVEKDVRFLWSLGRFDDVREQEPEPGALVFRVKPRPRVLLRDIRFEPHSFGLELKLPPGRPSTASVRVRLPAVSNIK
jgi:hypothetical protein